MAAIRMKPKKNYQPVVTFTADEFGTQVPEFIPGQCICKSCKSRSLTYYAYLRDAKCECGQWQLEELNMS